MRKRIYAALLVIAPLSAGCNASMPFGLPKWGGQASAPSGTSLATNAPVDLRQYGQGMKPEPQWSWKTPFQAAGKMMPFHAAESDTNATTPRGMSADDPLSLRNTPTNIGPEIYLRAAELYEASGNLDRAAAQYKLAINAAPKDATVLCGYARLLSRQGKLEEAVHYYTTAAQAQPENASIHNDLGLCLARFGQFDASLQALDYAIQLRPQETLYRNNIARVLVECGRPDEALQHLTAVHTPAVAHYNVGYMLYERQQKELAGQHFAQAIQLDPSFVKADRMLQLLAGRMPAEVASGAPVPNPGAAPQQMAPPQQVSPPQGNAPTPAAPPTLLPPAMPQRY